MVTPELLMLKVCLVSMKSHAFITLELPRVLNGIQEISEIFMGQFGFLLLLLLLNLNSPVMNLASLILFLFINVRSVLCLIIFIVNYWNFSNKKTLNHKTAFNL